ncbi:Dyp-type peroxidase domain-containing protein [Oscillatoria sp. FACHB-1406]|uniref:Dyp-type peroxidase n=1 Tax=Oscillatoria sp. FACHB-1406 TaxID=2692846 RepID=UPI0018EF4637|nr:Dyp-type peroxidase domain-containing protein [Oscillatoria sp. FACHB-1406]
MVNLSKNITKISEIITSFDEFEHDTLLAEIQGNILKSHGRNHSVYLFLKFSDKEAAKRWIGRFAHKYVTSALAQAEQAKQYRQNQAAEGQIFANFFLTRSGYEFLGYQGEQIPQDQPFLNGMKHPEIQKALGDDVNQWEPSYQQEIHAFVLLAADKILGPRTEDAKHLERKNPELLRKHPVLLARKAAKLEKEIAGFAEVVHKEIGYVLRSDKTGEEIEHFGFRDGVSQPLFFKRDIDRARKHSDFSQWDPRAPLNLVLFKDPLGTKEESYGSFFVFRKLEQNVKAWNEDIKQLAEKLKGTGEPNPELAGAYTMGRFQDGTPVIVSEKPLYSESEKEEEEEDNFNYSQDTEGLKCPFFAHARKVNPRGDTGNLEREKMNRIVRRGINYGPLPSEEPETDAGLLFSCFQADLLTQFHVMQEKWANNCDFYRQGCGTDPVVGVEKKDENGQLCTETYQWPSKWGEPEKTQVDFIHWVLMKGGEYFFAPSMSFLKSLAPAPSRNIIFRGVPKQEIEAAQATIAELEKCRETNCGIGLCGDPLEPDELLTFFYQRNLPFKAYLIEGLVLGSASAYQQNITTLEQYIEDLCNQEIEASEYKIAELEEYKELYWAIGLQGDTLEPDDFVNFFGERDLPFQFFVRGENVLLGDESAYDQNIKILIEYIHSLERSI